MSKPTCPMCRDAGSVPVRLPFAALRLPCRDCRPARVTMTLTETEVTEVVYAHAALQAECARLRDETAKVRACADALHITGDGWTEWRAAIAVLASLVGALPRCDDCPTPATHAYRRGEARWCWKHAPVDAPPYPRAKPLRRALALLEGDSG